MSTLSFYSRLTGYRRPIISGEDFPWFGLILCLAVMLWPLYASAEKVEDAGIQQVDIGAMQEKAAAGDAYAQLNLGAAYDNGLGVERDIKKALQWYQMAAEQGLAKAQYNLAHLLVTEELSEVAAAEWMRKAAEQGMVDAEYLMGVFYAEGIGVEMNESEARLWLQKAVDKGHSEAQRFLKEMGQ